MASSIAGSSDIIEPETVSAAPATATAGSLPDYSFWTEEIFTHFPGLVTFHESINEKSWIWRYGFRMRDPRVKPAKALWICHICCRRRKPTPSNYTYVASTTGGIERHLRKSHGIEVCRIYCNYYHSINPCGSPRKKSKSHHVLKGRILLT